MFKLFYKIPCYQPVLQLQSHSNSTYDHWHHQNYQLRPSTDSEAVCRFITQTCRKLKFWSWLPNKPSPRDVLPMSLLKSCLDEFATLITHLTNQSLTDDVFPHLFKTVQVLPLLKKLGLDWVNPAYHRPISNHNTILKIAEQLILVRLQPHLLASRNFNPLQSAYCNSHSKETALMDSLYKAADDKRLTTLISLDKSTAFDTNSHSIQYSAATSWNGVWCNGPSTALNWLQSYSTHRWQFVNLGQCCAPQEFPVPWAMTNCCQRIACWWFDNETSVENWHR